MTWCVSRAGENKRERQREKERLHDWVIYGFPFHDNTVKTTTTSSSLQRRKNSIVTEGRKGGEKT